MRRKVSFRNFDKLLFLAPIAIFVIGLLSVYSGSYKSGQALGDNFASKQFMWVGVGALCMILIARRDYFKIQDFVWPFYFVSIFFLLIVLVMPARMGAHRWIGIGNFNFQPSELSKLAVIFTLGHFFTTNRYEYTPFRKKIVPFLIVGAPFLLILKEPDLGTGLTLIPVFFTMLYLWGFRFRYLAMMVLGGVAVSPLLFTFLREYQNNRILVFLDPNRDPLGAGYNIIQSKIAIGSGGIFGKGFMGGTQNQLNFTPERHTDFIFSVMAEEGGFLLSFFVILLFWLIVKRGYSIASQTPDRFGAQLALGITTMIGVQTVINLGMTMGILPVVGMPLPLVSYGGTSILMTLLSIGLLISIKIHRPIF